MAAHSDGVVTGPVLLAERSGVEVGPEDPSPSRVPWTEPLDSRGKPRVTVPGKEDQPIVIQ